MNLEALGTTFAVFDQQDSGCVSYGVQQDSGRRLFVKISTTPGAVDSLRRALALHSAVSHPAIVAPLEAHELPSGDIAIVYPWRDGDILRPPSRERFLALPVPLILDAIDTILDAHLTIAAAGFVEADLYDGAFLYDFDRERMQLIDLDEYRPGPFTVEDDRLPGSRRFMAPEQWRRGATIDERTTVYVLGRAARLLLTEASQAQEDVIATATDPDPDRRFPTVADLAAAWRQVAVQV